jgi:DUF4097 and DUF4098 domain-containing protein YvlB
MRLSSVLMLASLLAAMPPVASAQHRDERIVVHEKIRTSVARAYQGRDRGPEQTERFSRKVKVGRDGRVSIGNIAGDITVTGGTGDDVSIEAVKRTRGDAGQLASVHIVVDDRAGRLDVRTDHTGRNDRVSVDYVVTVPASASIEVKSVSGNVKVSTVQGPVRAETISGNVTTAATPRIELAKSVSGDVDLTDAGADADLTASSVSGTLRARGLKARALDLGTISGDVVLTNVECERLGVKSVSGDVEFSGALARNGRYNVTSHSGDVRLILSGSTGFELTASTFSGSIKSQLPLTIGGDRERDGRRRGPDSRSVRGTFGDGSAALAVRTFSGDIVVEKR